jgi:alpha-ribazole phosphatase
MEVVFVRHGQTNYNLRHLCNSDPLVDVCLTGLGKDQARNVGEKLKGELYDSIYVSDLPRTRESSEIIREFGSFGEVEVKEDKRISDRKTGFEGRLVSDFRNVIEEDVFYFKPEGGESFQEEKERVFSFLEDLRKMDYKRVLVVSHGEPIQIVVGYFEKLTDQEIWERRIDNCDVFRFEL